MRRSLVGAFLFALAVQPAGADTLTYTNARFGTSVTFPAELFEQRMELPGNGDGMRWTSASGASIAVYGGNNALDLTPETLIQEQLARGMAGFEVTYHRAGDNWAVVSGVEDGAIFYQRSLFGADEVIHTVLIKYPPSARDAFDPVVGDIAGSLTGP